MPKKYGKVFEREEWKLLNVADAEIREVLLSSLSMIPHVTLEFLDGLSSSHSCLKIQRFQTHMKHVETVAACTSSS